MCRGSQPRRAKKQSSSTLPLVDLADLEMGVLMSQSRAKSTADRAESTAHRVIPVADDSEGSTANCSDESDDPLSGPMPEPPYLYDQDQNIMDAAIVLVRDTKPGSSEHYVTRYVMLILQLFFKSPI